MALPEPPPDGPMLPPDTFARQIVLDGTFFCSRELAPRLRTAGRPGVAFNAEQIVARVPRDDA